MKILLTSLYYYPSIGGVENSLRYIAKELKKLGHEVVIMTFDNKESIKKIDKIEDVEVHRYFYRSSKLSYFSYKRIQKAANIAFEELLNHFVPDEIWSRNTFVTSGLIRNENVKKIKHIYSTTTELNIKGLYSNIRNLSLFRRIIFYQLKFIDRHSLNVIDKKVIASKKVIPITFSRMMSQQIKEEFKISNKKINVVKPGVDNKIFRVNFTENEKLVAKRKYPILFQDYLLYVGRLAPAKNLEILIDALIKLKDIKLILVGEGPISYVNFIKNKISALGLNDRVYFIGKQDSLLPIIYFNAKITILPTIVETFGQVLIESLACGTPVLGFGNNPKFKTASNEIILHKSNGKVVDSYDSFTLSESISKILNDLKNNKEKTTTANRSYIQSNFTWDKTVKEIINL